MATSPSRFALQRAANVILSGGVVAYPTEAVYGLGCDPMNETAVLRVLALKKRSPDKGLIVIAADIDQLAPLIRPLDEASRKVMLDTWPGPVTWVVPSDAPPWLTGGRGTLAVRVTAHPESRALCRRSGMALVSTSANVSARPPARTALAVRQAFSGAIDYILPGRTGGNERPSELKDLATGRVLRAG